jgi:hypothetical protein
MGSRDFGLASKLWEMFPLQTREKQLLWYITSQIWFWGDVIKQRNKIHHIDGKPIYFFFGISTFSQYSVMDDASYAKVNPKAPFDKICLLGAYGIAIGERNLWCSIFHCDDGFICWCAWFLQITFSSS